MTLLLGPPSSGKTTLLLALAGKLSHDLKVRNTHFMAFKILEEHSFYLWHRRVCGGGGGGGALRYNYYFVT
jgi:Ni2+-binding GTPase involved in maturation of urease and hydrogenase